MTAPLTAAQVAADLRTLSAYDVVDRAYAEALLLWRKLSRAEPHSIETRIAEEAAHLLFEAKEKLDAMIADAAPVEAIKLNAQAAADEAEDARDRMSPEGRALFDFAWSLTRGATVAAGDA